MIWQMDTQPLPRLFAYARVPRHSTLPDTFVAYLRRHGLSITDAAHLARLPSLLVWRVAKWLPITERNAWTLVSALAKATGEHFDGFVLIARNATRPEAIRFLA